MKKSRLLWIGIIVLVVIAANILVYNFYLISPNIRYAGLDKFGIKEIYPTKIGGEEWFMNMVDPGHDPRVGGEGPQTTFVQQNDDGLEGGLESKLYFIIYRMVQ
jgi:ABC-type cobalt transport system substrate-binding protein